MELIVSRGRLNGDPQKYPVIAKGVSLAMGSSYARNVFQSRLGPGETMETSMNQYVQSESEVRHGYEPVMDLYVAWCNALVRDSKHLMARVFFSREGREHVFAGGRNVYAVYALDTPDKTQ